MSTALEELPLSSIASAVVAILARVDSKGTKDCVPAPSLFRDPGDDVAYVWHHCLCREAELRMRRRCDVGTSLTLIVQHASFCQVVFGAECITVYYGQETSGASSSMVIMIVSSR